MKKALYVMYDEGVYIGIFTAEQISVKTGITKERLYDSASKGILYKKRYMFRRKSQASTALKDIKTNGLSVMELCEAWDQIRMILNPEAKVCER